jgi:hypothetical protein
MKVQARFWKPLKSIVKIYGMAKLGVIFGAIGCLIAMLIFGFMWSIAGAIPGYFIGDYLAKSLHDGKAQRFIRWYFGAATKGSNPPSWMKLFF